MPIVRKFIYGVDDDTGLYGLIPTWIQEASPVQAVAHDMLEHRLKEVGSPVTAELQAIGAILALRVENGAFFAGRTEAEVLAYLIFEMVLDMCRGKPLDRIGKTRKLSDLDIWVENTLQAAVPKAFELARRDHAVDGDYTLEDLEAVERDQLQDIIGWIRRGYRYTVQRYAEVDRYTLAHSLFKKLDRASENLVCQDLLQVGDEVVVSACTRTGSFKFYLEGNELLV